MVNLFLHHSLGMKYQQMLLKVGQRYAYLWKHAIGKRYI